MTLGDLRWRPVNARKNRYCGRPPRLVRQPCSRCNSELGFDASARDLAWSGDWLAATNPHLDLTRHNAAHTGSIHNAQIAVTEKKFDGLRCSGFQVKPMKSHKGTNRSTFNARMG